MNIGVDLAPSAAARVLDNPRIELLVSTTLSSERMHTAFVRLLESDAATQLVDEFFDSGLFDRFITRLVESEALWELIDTIADSPAVTAAITQQSLGFADQMGEEVRVRSRKADDWLERAARRLIRRHPELSQTIEGPDPAAS